MEKPKEKEEPQENFDQGLEKLKAIVEKMEQGGLTLDESLKLFEEGSNLSRRLFEILNQSEGRVEERLASMEKIPFSRNED